MTQPARKTVTGWASTASSAIISLTAGSLVNQGTLFYTDHHTQHMPTHTHNTPKMRRRGEYAERHPPATNPQHTTQGAHAVSPQGASPIGTPETRCGQGKAGVADQGSGEPSATRCVAVNPGAHNPALVGRAGSTRTHPLHTYSKESVVGASTGRARPGPSATGGNQYAAGAWLYVSAEG